MKRSVHFSILFTFFVLFSAITFSASGQGPRHCNKPAGAGKITDEVERGAWRSLQTSPDVINV